MQQAKLAAHFLAAVSTVFQEKRPRMEMQIFCTSTKETQCSKPSLDKQTAGRTRKTIRLALFRTKALSGAVVEDKLQGKSAPGGQTHEAR